MGRYISDSIRLFFSYFLLVFIIFVIRYSEYLSINAVSVAVLTILTAFLIISNYDYYRLLTHEGDKGSTETYHVVEIEELTVNYINTIIITHIFLLLPVLLNPIKGLIIFTVSSIFMFALIKNSTLLFFNPLIFVTGNHVYRIKVSEHNKTIYVIYKEKIQEGDYIKIKHFYESIYLDEKIIKKKE